MGYDQATIIDVNQWIPLVYRVAKKMIRRGERLHELVSDGFLGLASAARMWDEFSTEATFMTYAWKCITCSIIQGRSDNYAYRACRNRHSSHNARWLRRRGPRSLILFSEFGSDYVRGCATEFATVESAEREVDEHDEFILVLRKTWPVLTRRQRNVLALRFGLRSGFPRSCAEIASALGVTASTVKQTEDRATFKLRRAWVDYLARRHARS